MKKMLPVLFVFLSSITIPMDDLVAQQNTGLYSAQGSGSGTTKEEAIEAARINAANNLIFTVIKRDAVFRDLFVPEAFKNGWFHTLEVSQQEDGTWIAQAEIEVDESLVEALYVGRYSTTVTNLLDAAEAAIIELEDLMAEGGVYESNADLGGAETAYRRAEAKTDEILRYLSPVEDAVYFSTLGKRKAPELKALVASYKASSQAGIERIRSGQQRLDADTKVTQVLNILEDIESELPAVETLADEIHTIASAPRSYTTEQIRTSHDQGQQAIESMEHRRTLIQNSVEGLPEELQYPRTRASLLLNRLDEVEQRLEKANSKLSQELTLRSPPLRTLIWITNHEPSDHAALSIMLPFGIYPDDGGGAQNINFPTYIQARAEGSFGLGSSGFWCRTMLDLGRELLFEDSDNIASQSIEAGFFETKLLGVGMRWDWARNGSEDSKKDSVVAFLLILGNYGTANATHSGIIPHPVWITTFSWEIPKEDDTLNITMLNLGLSSVLRPSPSIRLEGNAASRIRTLTDYDWIDRWEASFGIGFAFRLPIFRPLLWRLRWEGSMIAPLMNDEVVFDDAQRLGGFRFGLEYTF